MNGLIIPPELLAGRMKPIPVIVMVDITYRRPDHAHILQSYFQDMEDVAPLFPAVSYFIYGFWMKKIDGPLERVRLQVRTKEGQNLAHFAIPINQLN